MKKCKFISVYTFNVCLSSLVVSSPTYNRWQRSCDFRHVTSRIISSFWLLYIIARPRLSHDGVEIVCAQRSPRPVLIFFSRCSTQWVFRVAVDVVLHLVQFSRHTYSFRKTLTMNLVNKNMNCMLQNYTIENFFWL
jgi:hypothetical protein